ncbi:peroxidase-related enzyme [Rhodococcus sp. NPDC003318]|uniref:peroxidase-related enzyme n=1 Tax=Rhodococcus sp. NPDC003318 TaxID=3364503 RepID=UPI00369EB78A
MSAPTDLRISRLRVPTPAERTPEVARFFEATERREGHIPNWLSAFSLGQDHFQRLNRYLFPLLEGSADAPGRLTLREREILATIVSVDNGCAYCHTLHVDGLGKVLDDHWLAHRVALDHREVEELSEREHLLADLALVLTRTPGEVSDDRIEALREVDLSDEDIFEAVQIVSIINATNRITLALGVLPDRQIFADHGGHHDGDR